MNNKRKMKKKKKVWVKKETNPSTDWVDTKRAAGTVTKMRDDCLRDAGQGRPLSGGDT
jgi:hypothetical protein